MARPGHYDWRQGRIRQHHVCCYCGCLIHAISRQPHGIRHEPRSLAACERIWELSGCDMSSGVCAPDKALALAEAAGSLDRRRHRRLVGVA